MRHCKWMMILALAGACGGPDGTKKETPAVCTEDCEVDPAGSTELSVGALSGELSEGGDPVTSVLKLKREPSADVQVLVVSLDPDVATVEPAEFTFTTQTWNSSQLLTITPVDDRIQEETQTAEIEFTLVSDDPGFGGRPVSPLIVEVLDDDEPGSFIVESDDGFETSEDGTPVVFDVALSDQPDGDVAVQISVDDETEAEVDVTSLTFTELNWNIAQKVTVTGIDDREADGDQTYNLVLGPTNSTGAKYNGLPPENVPLTSIDGVCGNDVVDGAESCEPTPGEAMTCDYGVEDCSYCNDECQQVDGVSAGYCGDGQVQSNFESCDEPEAPCPYGQMSCVACSNCQEVAGEVTGYCGDGVVQQGEGEECDGSVCCSSGCQLDLNNCDVGCLIISEYVEAAGNDKAIELYNCDNTAVALDGMELCLVRNGESDCSRYEELTGTLAAGDTLTFCNTSSTFPSNLCDVYEGNATQFNGDDRIVLNLNLDGATTLGSSDVIIDVFGQISRQPLDQPWESKNYTRCNFTAFDGGSTFNLSSYWEDTGACDEFGCDYPQVHGGLKVPPSETCF